jgi:SAM-dependent methyltransferase
MTNKNPFVLDPYTRLTRAWLDIRYRDSHGHPSGLYYAHEPIYGIGALEQEPSHARRIVRLFQLLRRVREAGGRTLLDVGGSEGYLAQLCRELFGMECISVDLSAEACRRAAELFGLPACAVDCTALPFASNSIDVVTCAEVVEHLAQPVPALLEMQRVTAGAFVLSTEEWQESAERRDEALQKREGDPHGERSILADVDMKALFSPYHVTFERQVVPDLERFGDDHRVDVAELRKAMLALPPSPQSRVGTMGIVALLRKDRQVRRLPRTPSDPEIADHLLRRRMERHWLPERTPLVAWPDWGRMSCVDCSADLTSSEAGWRCRRCGRDFPRQNGIVSFLHGPRPLTERIGRMLEERGTAAYARQGADLLALADKLQLPFNPPREWSLSNAEDLAKWALNAHVRQEGSTFAVDGNDPQLHSPWLGLSCQQGGTVSVECAVTGAAGDPPDAYAEMFWWGEGDPYFSEEKSAHLVIPADGKLRTHVFRAPPGALDPEGILLRVRFDPTSGTRGRVRVGRVRIG